MINFNSLMPQSNSRRSLAEKISFIISLFIVSTLVFLICYVWVSGDTAPPILSVSTEATRQVERQYYVPFTVTNSGGETANSVEVVAELAVNQIYVYTGRQQIDFLSRQESKSGEFIFERDPQQGTLTVRVASYQQP
ncbi:MAG: TIGR02588 family protein [Cyanobacteria bacterium J06631_6]